MFTMRTTKPSKGNKFYTTKSKGGYSTCIKGKPTDACDVLANCVGYACGRFNEIIGSMKYPSLNCNAENFIERAKSLGLEVVNYPVLGGIMVMQKGSTLKGSDGAGHVFIVEKIYDSNYIYTSESGYGSSAFWNSHRYNTNGRWGHGSGYKFRGCIVNPKIGKVKAPEKINVTYQVYDNQLKKYWGEITNYNNTNSNGYAGCIGHSIGGIRAKASKGTITIQSHIKGGKWLSPITKWDNTSNGYSGIYGKDIDMVMIKSSVGTARYRVHVKGGKWLGWVSKFNIKDSVNGMAGIYGKSIDAIQIEII